MWVREKADRDHMQAAERYSSPQSTESGWVFTCWGRATEDHKLGGLHHGSVLLHSQMFKPEVAAGLFPLEDRREIRPSPSPSSQMVCHSEIASACGIAP